MKLEEYPYLNRFLERYLTAAGASRTAMSRFLVDAGPRDVFGLKFDLEKFQTPGVSVGRFDQVDTALQFPESQYAAIFSKRDPEIAKPKRYAFELLATLHRYIGLMPSRLLHVPSEKVLEEVGNLMLDAQVPVGAHNRGAVEDARARCAGHLRELFEESDKSVLSRIHADDAERLCTLGWLESNGPGGIRTIARFLDELKPGTQGDFENRLNLKIDDETRLRISRQVVSEIEKGHFPVLSIYGRSAMYAGEET